MELPVNAILMHCLIEHVSGKIHQPYSVMKLTNRLGKTHSFEGHSIDDPTTELYLHTTDLEFVKEGVNPNLLRRALKRYTFKWNQDYFTSTYNSLIEFKLRIRDRDLEFCLTSDDALNKAVEWDTRYNDLTDIRHTQALCYHQREEYLRYAEVLEHFERIIDGYYQEQTNGK